MAMYCFTPFDWVRLAFEIALVFGLFIITFYQVGGSARYIRG
jgi:hypothetical protein